jgi:threonine-phosphate decarboxylase
MDLYDLAEKKGASPRRILDFTLCTNPLGPSNKAKHTMRAALKRLGLFPDPKIRHLRRYIARTFGVSPDQICFGRGSTDILDRLLAALKPRRALAPLPLTPYYAGLLSRHACPDVSPPFIWAEHVSFDVETFLKLADSADVLLLQNPHHLTGRVIMPEHIARIIDAVEGSRKTVVIDEAFIEFSGCPSPVERVVTSANAVIVRSFSLFHALAGFRLGYALANARILEAVRRMPGIEASDSVSAAAAITSMKDKGYHRRTREFMEAEKSYLLDRLARIGRIEVINSTGNLVIVRIQENVPDIEERFLGALVLVRTFRDEAGSTFLSVPIRLRRESARFIRTLATIMEKREEKPASADDQLV